ncbi:MAG: plasmid recombination protein [Clostridia bacterium]|nr:plasmid recombination protein [Clostridia bacterium]
MNCEKFTRNQSTNILVHCNRSDPNRTYKNQKIDHSKTHLNYNLAPEHKDMTDYEYMKKRCEEFKILKRKDVNWLVSWVITMPTDYTGSKTLFFREAYNFMENKYGKENVVSAYVHLDETSPHMHFCFVPVVFDKKKQEYKVNAKQCINKTELKQIHPQMQEYLETKLQTKVNILNGATAEGNKTIEQLKNEEKIKEKAILELIQNPTAEIKKYVIEQLPEEQKENIIEEEIEIIKEDLKKDPEFIQMCQNRAIADNEELEELEMEIENLKGKKDYMEESIAELEIHHKKQRKQLAEEFEREKQRNNARIIEMQNTTIKQEKDKPSFWNKIADKIFNFKLVATVSFVMYQLSNKVPPERILKNVKKFRKNYDRYVDNPELVQRELKTMEYMDIGLEKIEESEQIDLRKEELSKDEYEPEL